MKQEHKEMFAGLKSAAQAAEDAANKLAGLNEKMKSLKPKHQMKAQLKPVKAWMPHKDVKEKDHHLATSGSMRVYVGSLHVGWVFVTTTEPEELFKLEADKLLVLMDWNNTLGLTKVNREGYPLQKILDDVELVFKEFLNKVCK